MGKREVALGRVLLEADLREVQKPAAPRLDDLPAHLQTEILHLYRVLGGIQDQPRLAPGKWDLSFAGFVVELDEEQHFNQYRLSTLLADWATDLPWTSDYLRYSADHEALCSRKASHGGYWTKTSCERLFGPAGPKGDLTSSNGSPRWKQRALYDAMKDAYCVAGEVSLARLSCHDDVGGHLLGTVLDGKAPLDVDALRALLETRTPHH